MNILPYLVRIVRGDAVNQLHTPKEIGKMLQVSKSTVERMAYSGDLPYILIRRGKRKKTIRFDSMTVEKWLAKQTLKSS